MPAPPMPRPSPHRRPGPRVAPRVTGPGLHPLARALRLALAGGIAAFACLPVSAQDGAGQGLRLRPSERLLEQLPREAAQQAPTFVYGQTLRGVTDQRTVVEGDVELRRHGTVLRADFLEHEQASDTVHARGRVRIHRDGNLYEGPELQLKLDTSEGWFEQPRFSLLRSGGYGDAQRVDFLGKDKSRATRATYTSCERQPGPSWLPDWVVSASSIDFDQAEDVGIARNGVLRFRELPVLAAPILSFPLSDKRKSGVLPPTFNIDNVSGFELTLPYYLNLAPNRDATLYPTLMTRRGIDLAGEYRYLERDRQGVARAAIMPGDRLRDSDRWGYALQHSQALGRVGAIDGTGLRLNLNRVSDDNYWRDFPRSSTSLTSRLLANDVVASGRVGRWSLSAGIYTWQTLQDTASPITAPYDRLPSLAARYTPAQALRLGPVDGIEWSVQTEFTRFDTARAPTVSALPNGRNDLDGTRWLAVASVTRPWQAPGWYVKPALQLHARAYGFEQTLGNGRRSEALLVPTFSTDAGLVFEREAGLFGRDFLQTLEPRVFYAHTPRRDQAFLPNYDTAAFDFNLDTVYLASPYGGNDRIADAQTVTAGVTTRLLNPATGAETASLGVAQRLRLREQQVVLPGETALPQGASDLLVGGRLNWNPQWSVSGTVQWDLKNNESVRTTLGTRYSPGNYRVVSAAYRLQRGTSEQLDIGWQWPLNDLIDAPAPDRGPGRGLGPQQWYSVGRINYSVPERRVVDLVAGIEYDGGCWVSRAVIERLQTGLATATRRLLFQIEFVGFSRLGSNPLQTLKNNVPRYQYLREEINPPSRFEHYD